MEDADVCAASDVLVAIADALKSDAFQEVESSRAFSSCTPITGY